MSPRQPKPPLTETELERLVRWRGKVDDLSKPQLVQLVQRLRRELDVPRTAPSNASETLAKIDLEHENAALRKQIECLRTVHAPEPAPVAPVTLLLDDSPEARALIEKLAERVKQAEPVKCECGEPATEHRCADCHAEVTGPTCPDCDTERKCPQCTEPETPECENCNDKAKHVFCDDCFNEETRADLFDELVNAIQQPARNDVERLYQRHDIERILERAGCNYPWPVAAGS